MKTSFYSKDELGSIGFACVGDNVKISRKTSIYGAEKISIGNNVRIDDFCVLSGNIKIGSHIHISAFVALYGGGGIVMEDYTGISPRSTVYSAMDDFSGDYLIGPIHPSECININRGSVFIKRYSQIGTHCIIFPGVTIGEGSITGAMTLVTKDTLEWGVYVGQPARLLKQRKKGLLELVAFDK